MLDLQTRKVCAPFGSANGPINLCLVVFWTTPRSHRCKCRCAALCAHGHGGQVRSCHVVRARAIHACDVFSSPVADAPSSARRLSCADARSNSEGAARQTLFADEAGESWSGQGHHGFTRRCLSRAGVRTQVLGSLTCPAAGERCWGGFRSKVSSEESADSSRLGNWDDDDKRHHHQVCHTELALHVCTEMITPPTHCAPASACVFNNDVFCCWNKRLRDDW